MLLPSKSLKIFSLWESSKTHCLVSRCWLSLVCDSRIVGSVSPHSYHSPITGIVLKYTPEPGPHSHQPTISHSKLALDTSLSDSSHSSHRPGIIHNPSETFDCWNSKVSFTFSSRLILCYQCPWLNTCELHSIIPSNWTDLKHFISCWSLLFCERRNLPVTTTWLITAEPQSETYLFLDVVGKGICLQI